MTQEEFLEKWTPPWLADMKAVVRAFLRDYAEAQAKDAAATDPYHGKREVLVLPQRERTVDRGVSHDSAVYNARREDDRT
jgi:hypothetical protein